MLQHIKLSDASIQTFTSTLEKIGRRWRKDGWLYAKPSPMKPRLEHLLRDAGFTPAPEILVHPSVFNNLYLEGAITLGHLQNAQQKPEEISLSLVLDGRNVRIVTRPAALLEQQKGPSFMAEVVKVAQPA
jgi:hypothetical protein